MTPISMSTAHHAEPPLAVLISLVCFRKTWRACVLQWPFPILQTPWKSCASKDLISPSFCLPWAEGFVPIDWGCDCHLDPCLIPPGLKTCHLEGRIVFLLFTQCPALSRSTICDIVVFLSALLKSSRREEVEMTLAKPLFAARCLTGVISWPHQWPWRWLSSLIHRQGSRLRKGTGPRSHSW
jgi:hypothetical protein